MIPYGHQDISAEDIAAVTRILKSDFLTQGSAVPEFESSVARYCGAEHAIAVNSATSALHLTYLGLDLGPGKILWTSPITFVATANAARLCGAHVDFVDIELRTGNMSIDALKLKLIEAEEKGTLPNIVVPVHFGGRPCEMQELHALANKYGFAIVEDASHAIGAEFDQHKTGGCHYSAATIFSFHPVKLITTGEGGMILTHSDRLAHRTRLLRSHGITRDAQWMTGASHGDWYYQQVMLGLNYRMTDIQAALGTSQMSRLDYFLQRRRELVMRYENLLAPLLPVRPLLDRIGSSAWHLYVVNLGRGYDRKVVFDFMRQHGIGVNVHYIPVHLQPYYQALGFASGDFPVSESFYQDALTLPLYPGLTESQQDEVVDKLEKALKIAQL